MDNNKKIPSGSKLSLEELLQLKKFEQPNEKFWKRFDIELQRKTLQSLVKSPSIKDRFLSLLPSFQEHAFLSTTPLIALLAITILSASNFFQKNESIQISELKNPSIAKISDPKIVANTNQNIDLLESISQSETDFLSNDINNIYFSEFADQEYETQFVQTTEIVNNPSDNSIYFNDSINLEYDRYSTNTF